MEFKSDILFSDVHVKSHRNLNVVKLKTMLSSLHIKNTRLPDNK